MKARLSALLHRFTKAKMIAVTFACLACYVAGGLLLMAGNRIVFPNTEYIIMGALLGCIFLFQILGKTIITVKRMSDESLEIVWIQFLQKIGLFEHFYAQQDASGRARRKNLRQKRRLFARITVVFYCNDTFCWNTYDALYRLMQKDKRFRPVLLAVPEMEGDNFIRFSVRDFFKEKKLKYRSACDDNHRRWINLKSLRTDYIVFNRHYACRQPTQLTCAILGKYGKMCYIPYVACCANGSTQDIVCGFSELKDFELLFSENHYLTQIYGTYKAAYPNAKTKIATVGSPKFDAIISLKTVSNTDDEQVVLYTPRWNLSEGVCSFFELYEFFFTYAGNHPEIRYIFRPHPLMKQEIGAMWGEHNWDEFVTMFQHYDNAEIDFNPDYLPSFSKATILVSDMSSMMFEFILTGKPIIYMNKKDCFNEFGKSVSRGFYCCSTADDVEKRLHALRSGNDPLASMRQRVLEEDYTLCDGHSAERIRDVILSDYAEQYRRKEKESRCEIVK